MAIIGLINNFDSESNTNERSYSLQFRRYYMWIMLVMIRRKNASLFILNKEIYINGQSICTAGDIENIVRRFDKAEHKSS